MMTNKPVKDKEAQFDLVEEERTMSMVGGDPNPPYRFLGVPVKTVCTKKDQGWYLGCQALMGFCLPTASRA